MNHADGDHELYLSVADKVKGGERLTKKDKELIVAALINTAEDAYYSTGGRNVR